MRLFLQRKKHFNIKRNMGNSETDKTSEQMLHDITSHIKESMCVNGTVEFNCMTTVTTKHKEVKQGMLFEINDARRGKFFIAWIR